MRHDTPETIYAELMARTQRGDPRLVVTFPVELPAGTTPEEVEQWLAASGFTRVQAEREVATPTGPRKVLDVVADRFRIQGVEKARAIEAIEVALKRGAGRMSVYAARGRGSEPTSGSFSTGLHCPDSDIRYADPIPSMFSFNSPVGACETCRGFGRVIGVDYGLVIPNDKLTLRAGAIKPMQTPAWQECQDDLMRHAETAGIPRDTPWYKLTPEQKHWVIHGTPNYREGNWNKQWYGVRRFFEYLESKAYKMHIRVLLVQVPQLHAVRDLRRRPPEARKPAVAPGQQGRRRRGAGARPSASCRWAWTGRASSWRRCRGCACTT